jgi:hypothetical protein
MRQDVIEGGHGTRGRAVALRLRPCTATLRAKFMTVERQIEGFLARYTPEVRGELEGARRRLRAWFPRGFELVFDNYNALVFAYSPSERSSQCMLSVAGYPRWITLFFAHGTELPDPTGRLGGSGASIRSIRLAGARELDAKDVRALIGAAVARVEEAFSQAPRRTTQVRTAVARVRPRRPAAAKKKAGKSKA